MNEEVSRILQMLEAGKINAGEAERLIRALGDAGSGPRAEEAASSEESVRPVCLNPFRDLQELFRIAGEMQARAVRRQSRWAHWRHYRWTRQEAEARGKRAETMDTAERVRFVLTDRVVVDRQDFDGNTPLSDLIHASQSGWERPRRIAWDNLRYGLEDEFQIEIPADDVDKWDTVQAIVGYVGGRVGGAHTSAAKPEESAKTKSGKGKTGAPSSQPA